MQIQLGGQLRTLKINMAAVDAYWEKINFERITSSSVYASVYGGLVGFDTATGVQVSDFDYQKVTEWVDELYLSETGEAILKAACQLFSDSAFYKSRLEKIEDKIRKAKGEVEKKSLTETAQPNTSLITTSLPLVV